MPLLIDDLQKPTDANQRANSSDEHVGALMYGSSRNVPNFSEYKRTIHTGELSLDDPNLQSKFAFYKQKELNSNIEFIGIILLIVIVVITAIVYKSKKINSSIKLLNNLKSNNIFPKKQELISDSYSDSYITKKKLLDSLEVDGIISEVVYKEKLSELEKKCKVEQNDYLVKKRLTVERKALDQSLDLKVLTEKEHKIMVDALCNKIAKEVRESFNDKTNVN